MPSFSSEPKNIKGGPSRKSDRTKAAILDTALELFAHRGFDDTSMSDIAAAAGVVRQTVLNHYPRKDDLVLAWGQRRRDRADAATGSFTADQTAGERLAQVYRTLAATNEAERDVSRALHPHFQAVARRRVVPESVLAAIEHGRSTGELDAAVLTAVVGEVLTAVYFDALSRWLDATEPGDLTATLLERVDLVLRGVRSGR